MDEFNLSDPHVLKPVEQSEVLQMQLKGIQQRFYQQWADIENELSEWTIVLNVYEFAHHLDDKNKQLGNEKLGRLSSEI